MIIFVQILFYNSTSAQFTTFHDTIYAVEQILNNLKGVGESAWIPMWLHRVHVIRKYV
jgi:hypothetical protein